MRIWVRIPNWVGDAVMSMPLLQCLANNFPDADLRTITPVSVRPVLRGCPALDHQLPYSRDGGWGLDQMREFMRCVTHLRAHPGELGFILPNSFSSALMMWAGGVRWRIGYRRDMRGPLLSLPVERPQHPDGSFRPVYMVDYYLGLAEHVGLTVSNRETRLFYADHDRAEVKTILRNEGLDPDKPLFVLHCTAGYGPSKFWPSEYFAGLADMLNESYGAQIACIGAPAAHSFIRLVQDKSPVKIHDLSRCGIDLHLLKPLLDMSRLLITTDSGPRHYGVALDTPTVCIMGPTHPDYSTSNRPNDHVVTMDVECGPCQEKECPLGHHRCMVDLKPELVFDACRAALREDDHDTH
ncbi:MAG: lipopolysaccharide heptosyltransferase II [Candidatus Brocadiia bacterium]